jgi:hypothetical protein
VLLLQAVAYRGCFPDASPLISMAAALLDLQHYCPTLLAAAADAALQQGSTPTLAAAEQGSQQEQQQQQGDDADGSSSSLAPEEVVSLLLALGFFRVPAPDCVESALEVRPGQQPDCVESALEVRPGQQPDCVESALEVRPGQQPEGAVLVACLREDFGAGDMFCSRCKFLVTRPSQQVLVLVTFSAAGAWAWWRV